jgi:hypothetical protein
MVVGFEEVFGDLQPEPLELMTVVEFGAEAWTGKRNRDAGAKRGAWSGGEGNNAVCHENGFVGIIGDEDDGAFILLPDL